ncbi:MAG: hypothetical protein EXS35_16425 [Pedosphaera sp.]|nr:hypothetical protein [Pedosphaera sp.]
MTPRFTVQGFEFFSHPTRTRFPFRYGIASMTEVPHLFARVRLQMDGREVIGLASEGLPPKWFTKNPATTFEQDLPEMLAVIGHAARLAVEIGAQPVTFFEFWRELSRQQNLWAETKSIAPLLANLGVSLIERAALDAVCRALAKPLAAVVRENLLGLNLGEIYAELSGGSPDNFLPGTPLATIQIRHTVGLTDPITAADIPANELVSDGLPQDLESCIRSYGLRAFKIKLSGKADHDLARLRALSDVISRETAGDFLTTVDGNENFKSFAEFRDFWAQLRGEPALKEFLSKVAVVEQPVHRDHALSENAREVLHAWPDRPLLIIDESEAALGDLPRALSLGYDGTSHKNCKGIVKGLANACLLEHRRRHDRRGVLTGEDLANLGPVALLPDLAVMALLGIAHAERNGHHYFRGLTLWPDAWQQATLAAHGDLYRKHEQGFVTLRIEDGLLDLTSVNQSPFGLQPLFDPESFAARLQP